MRKIIAPDVRPWALYARLSKAQKPNDEHGIQVGDLEKVEYQIEMCRNYAASRDLPVSDAHVYIDPSLSAWKKGVRRPEWDRLMSAAERGELAGVIVYAVDRFTRRPKDLETLIELAEDRGLMIEGPRSGRLDLTTATGRQQARWMAMQAASESDNTSERIKVTLARKMAAGKPMGGGRCYGFEVGGEVQRADEVAVIREMAKRMLAGEHLQHLAADMNRRGLRTVRGGKWTGANLGRMLDGHRYGGEVEHHGEIVGRMTGEPVFDRDTYDAVQALFASRRRGRRPTGRFPLTGLLTCSTCRRTMNGATRSKKLKDGTTVREYRCPIQLGGCGRAILADPVERIVGERLVEVLSDPDEAAAIVAKSAQLNEARSVQLAKLQAVEDQLVELEAKKAAGELIPAAYDKAKPILDRRWQAANAGLDELSPAVAASNYDAELDWADMTGDERRVVIRRYGVRIEITKGSKDQGGFNRKRVQFYRRDELLAA